MTNPTQLELFQMHMPDNLYRNHYVLSDIYPDYSPEEWRQFLKEHEHFIRIEVSAITEAEARSALQKLTKGDAKSADISAIKQLLEQSEQMNSRTKDQRTFVVTHTPSQEHTKTPEEQRYELVLQNVRNVHAMFDLDSSSRKNTFYERTNVKENADGTIHFTETFTELDKAYLRLFNPKNKHFDVLAPLDLGDVQ